MLYSVNEIFYSIQGEGFHAGRPAAFIRFAGCNLQCPWCDTEHRQRMTLTEEEIACEVRRLLKQNNVLHSPGMLIVLTGGEPLLQPELNNVILMLRASLYEPTIAIETNGILLGDQKITADWITVGFKPEVFFRSWEQTEPQYRWNFLRGDEIKIVLSSAAQEFMNELSMFKNRFHHFYIQPCSENYGPAVKFVKENPQWRLSLQTQKILSVQ